MWRELSKIFREVWELSAPSAGSYRPDRHYMRGPGPKWHAKYGGLAPKTSATAAPIGRGLREVAQHRA
jgi:hypothetical protein